MIRLLPQLSLAFKSALLVLFSLALLQDRLPVPDGAARDAAEAAIRNAYTEFADKTVAGRKALAQKLIADTSGDLKAATRYVMLADALDLATGVCDIDAAFQAINLLARLYDVNADSLRLDALRSSAAKARQAESAPIAQRGMEIIERYLAAGDLDDALQYRAPVQAVTNRSGDQALKDRFAASLPELDEYQRVKPSLDALKLNPADQTAALPVGRYYCFFKGDFDAGLPLLAQSTDVALHDLAADDIARPNDAGKQAELGRRWLAYAQIQTGKTKAFALARAAAWYELARGGLTDADALTAQNRLAEIDKMLAAATSNQAQFTQYLSGAPSVPADAVRKSIESGLLWLCRHQDASGGWSLTGLSKHCNPGSQCLPSDSVGADSYDTGITGLALLAFLGAGISPSSRIQISRSAGETQFNTWDAASRALKWLVSRQSERGSVSGDHPFLYCDCVAAIALCEGYRISKDESLHAPAQRLISFIERAQRHESGADGAGRWGWRYGSLEDVVARHSNNEIDEKTFENEVRDADTSNTAWAVRALYTAKLAGLAVSEDTSAGALAFLNYVSIKTGQVGYLTPEGAGQSLAGHNDQFRYHASVMSALGIEMRVLLDKSPDLTWIESAARTLTSDVPTASEPLSIDYYYWFEGASAWSTLRENKVGKVASMGGEWMRALPTTIVSLQEKDEHKCAYGGWMQSDRWCYTGGPVYATALNLMSLEKVSGVKLVVPEKVPTQTITGGRRNTPPNEPKSTPEQSKQFAVRASDKWQRSTITKQAGDVVHLDARGTWSIRSDTPSFTLDAGGLAGVAGLAEHGCAAPLGSLICRVGHQVFFVGKSRDTIIRETGLLEFRVNESDTELKDNDGEIDVAVSVLERNVPAILKDISLVQLEIGKGYRATVEFLGKEHGELQSRAKVTIEGGLGGFAGPEKADFWREQVRAYLPVRCQLTNDAELLVTRPFHPPDHTQRCQWSCALSGTGSGKVVKDCKAGDTR